MIAWLNRDDRLLISIRNFFFFGSPFGQNFKVKHAQLGVILGWVTDRSMVASSISEVSHRNNGARDAPTIASNEENDTHGRR